MTFFDYKIFEVTGFVECAESWVNASLARVVAHWIETGRSLCDLHLDWVDGPEQEPRVIAVKVLSDPELGQPQRLGLTVSARSWIWKLPGAIADGPGQRALQDLLWPAQEQLFLMELLAPGAHGIELPDWIKDWPSSSRLRLRAAWPSLARQRGTALGLKRLLGALLGIDPELHEIPAETRTAKLGAGARLGGQSRLDAARRIWRCKLRCRFGDDPAALRRRLLAVLATERPRTVLIDLEFVDDPTNLGLPPHDADKDETA